MRMLEAFKATWEPVDLSPRGHTVIDLHHWSTAATWKPWGSSYSTRPPAAEERAAFRASMEEGERIIARVRTKAEACAVLELFGVTPYASGTLADLRNMIYGALFDRWYPRAFVNEGVLKAGHGDAPCKYGCHRGCYEKRSA